jgi:catecholate siderophore receptor
MSIVPSSNTSESFSHRSFVPVVLKSSDGQIRVEAQIKDQVNSQFVGETPANIRFQGSNRASLLTAVSLVSLMATGAAAQETGLQLPTIDVTGDQAGGYQATQQTITRLPTPLKDTPQTINVVPQQVISEQRAVSMEDALRNIPGITFSAGEGGQQGDSPIIRGFVARGDIFRDGFRDPGWYTRDLFPVDRVEVYKGPSAFAFGRGSTGGAINNVSKLPTGATYVEGTATGTSVGGYRADVDASGQRGNISGRIAALYQDMPTPTRDNVYTKRWGVAPSISVPLDDATKATLAYVFQGEEGAPDYGHPYLPQPAYSPATGAQTNAGYNGNGSAVTPVPINRNIWFGIATGPYRDVVNTETHILTAMVERQLGSNFKLTNGIRYIDNDRFSRVTAPRSLFVTGTTTTPPPGTSVDQMSIGRERRERQTDATYLVNQTDLIGKFDTGIVNHTVATGLELSRETRSQSRTDLCLGTTTACRTSLTNPSSGGVDAAMYTVVPGNNTLSTNIAAYASDQMKITRYFELLASLRFDRYRTHYVDASAVAGQNDLERTDSMLSYRFGGVYHPTDNSSLYVAYGNSYNPSAELGTLSGATNNTASVTLEPEKNVSYEAGAKVDILGGGLSLTGAVFRIEKTNLRILNDPSLPAAQQFIVLDGLARVDGIELGVAGKLTDKWQLMAGYSYLKSEIVTTTNRAELGRELPNTPAHNFTLWTTYDITKAWTVGGGAIYQSDAFVNTTNTAYVPDYWKFDAMMSYKVDAKSTIQLNIYNITDVMYYAQYYGGHAVPASGRYASLSYRVRW